MHRSLERHKTGETRVIPVIIRTVDFELAPFSELQALPKDGKAIMTWKDRGSAWRDVAEGIKKTVKELRSKKE